MPLQDLEHAAGMLERVVHVLGLNGPLLSRVTLRPTLAFAGAARRLRINVLVHPRTDVVFPLVLFPAAEQSIVLLGILELLRDDGRCIREAYDVLPEVSL